MKAAADGDLSRVRRVIKLGGFVQAGPGFFDIPKLQHSVRETRQRIKMKSNVAPDVVGFHALCQQTIERESLVIAPRHQALDHHASHLLHGDDLLYGKAPDNQRVKAVEGAGKALHQPAAFRRIGIGIGHMGEIGRQRRRAMHGNGVALARQGSTGVRRKPDAESDDSTGKGSNARALRK